MTHWKTWALVGTLALAAVACKSGPTPEQIAACDEARDGLTGAWDNYIEALEGESEQIKADIERSKQGDELAALAAKLIDDIQDPVQRKKLEDQNKAIEAVKTRRKAYLDALEKTITDSRKVREAYAKDYPTGLNAQVDLKIIAVQSSMEEAGRELHKALQMPGNGIRFVELIPSSKVTQASYMTSQESAVNEACTKVLLASE